MVTLTLGVALIVKYILFDKPAEAALGILKRTRFANGKKKDEESEEEEAEFAAPLARLEAWDQSSAQGLYRKAVDGAEGAGTTRPRDDKQLQQYRATSENVLPSAAEGIAPLAADAEEPPSDARFTVGSAPASRRPSISLALSSISDQPENVLKLNETSSGATDIEREGEGREGVRTLDVCSSLLAAGRAVELSDDEVIQLVQTKRLPAYKLESSLDDPERGVSIRRRLLCQDETVKSSLDELPYSGYDYSKVCAHGSHCAGYPESPLCRGLCPLCV